MKRTIEVKQAGIIFRKKQFLSTMYDSLRRGFKLSRGKYEITIRLGKQYQFRKYHTGFRWVYDVIDISSATDKGRVCASLFNKLFFRPDGRKRYDITVKKVK